LCFAELHHADKYVDPDPYKSEFVTYRRIIGSGATQEFDKSHQRGTPPAIFHAFLGAFAAGIRSEVHRLFNDLLQIGIAHSASLKEHPTEWAKAHLSILLNGNKHVVKLWIRKVCDQQDLSKPLKTDKEIDEFIFWKDWRAPKLIYMQPSANLPYDPSTVWNREEEQMTERLLEYLSRRFIQSLGFDLEKITGDAHVDLVK
jgi:hypothetical protein